jgi:hypothetical protein
LKGFQKGQEPVVQWKWGSEMLKKIGQVKAGWVRVEWGFFLENEASGTREGECMGGIGGFLVATGAVLPEEMI